MNNYDAEGFLCVAVAEHDVHLQPLTKFHKFVLVITGTLILSFKLQFATG